MALPQHDTDTAAWVPEDTYGARLALVRQRLRLNVKAAATLCGINPQSWRNWEAGGVPQNIYATSARIAEATRCSEAWLVGGQNRKKMIRADLRLVTDAEPTVPGPGQMELPLGPRLHLVPSP